MLFEVLIEGTMPIAGERSCKKSGAQVSTPLYHLRGQHPQVVETWIHKVLDS